MDWIEIACASCFKDSRFCKRLNQVRLGVWWCDECVERAGVELKDVSSPRPNIITRKSP